ncbi:hypothetical protein [Candidatus Pelagibacter sp. Uisw_130]|uniref:hypothetical protein n=1 Tax=Candidatus Pelagibacter sp. Uisw_130 TaxID=3230989 RepID=UPI0039EBC557
MKKILRIMVLGLLWCSVVFADVNEIGNSYIYPSQLEKIKKHLKQYVEKAKNKQLGIYKE